MTALSSISFATQADGRHDRDSKHSNSHAYQGKPYRSSYYGQNHYHRDHHDRREHRHHRYHREHRAHSGYRDHHAHNDYLIQQHYQYSEHQHRVNLIPLINGHIRLPGLNLNLHL